MRQTIPELSQLASISENIDEPDFYIRRKGSVKTLGDVSKQRPEGSHKSSWLGIKLNEIGIRFIDPDFLYYIMMTEKSKGTWAKIAKGTLNLVHITKSDIESFKLPFKLPVELDDSELEKNSSDSNHNTLTIKNRSRNLLNIFKAASGDSAKMESLVDFLQKTIASISAVRHKPIAKHTYVVGGAVRNHLLKKDIKDIDIVIDSIALGGYDSDSLAKDLAERIPAATSVVTNQYGVSILNVKSTFIIGDHDFDGEQLEIANARSESYTGEGYKPEEVKPATIEDDVLRREFTFNTLMWRIADLAEGFDKAEIIDLTGCGVKDLESGEMRCPKDPDEVFSDDPSRMLRAVKFIAKYNFKLPEEVRESIIRNSDKVKNIPPNQIGTIIINQILKEPNYRTSLRLMSDLNLLSPIRDILVSPKNNDEEALRSFLLSHSKEREVGFLLSLLEIGLPLSGPISFLSESQRNRLGEITADMSAVDGWNFIGLLSNPGNAVKDGSFFPSLLKEFTKSKSEIPSFNNNVYKPAVISLLLETPELKDDPVKLRKLTHSKILERMS